MSNQAGQSRDEGETIWPDTGPALFTMYQPRFLCVGVGEVIMDVSGLKHHTLPSTLEGPTSPRLTKRGHLAVWVPYPKVKGIHDHQGFLQRICW